MNEFTKDNVKLNIDSETITTDIVKTVCNDQETTKAVVNNLGDDQTRDSITNNAVNIPIIDINKSGNKKKSNRYDGTVNLKPVRTKEEARERGRIGGIKSGEVRRQKKTMRETLENALKIELSEKKLKELGADISLMNGENSVLSAIIASTIREAINGDTKAIQFVRDSIGEQPINKQEVTQEIITKDDLDMMENVRKQLLSS